MVTTAGIGGTRSVVAWPRDYDTSDEELSRRETVYDADGEREWDDDKIGAAHRAADVTLAQQLLTIATTPRTEQQLDNDEDYCLVRVFDDEKQWQLVSALPREWRFLVEYFYNVRNYMTFDDADRVDPLDERGFTIGRDDATRWRINWNIPSQQADYNPVVRNAIILQAMLAQVDHTAWVKALTEIMQFKPPAFAHIDGTKPGSPIVPFRFAFTFRATLHSRDYEWSRFVKGLFRPRYRSYDMMWDYCSAYQVVTAKGVDMATMEPIPLKLRFAPEYCGYSRQVVILKNIMKVIAKAKKIEDQWMQRRPWQACPQLRAPPAFRVESIDLDLREFTVHSSVLNALEKLVATAGVRVENLTLPSREHDGVHEKLQLRAAWASLLCTVMGIQDARPNSRHQEGVLPGADRLVIPSSYMYVDFSLPFFMAARDARGVKSVRIEMGDGLQHRRNGYDRHLGSLIGYAFFNPNTPSSIVSLDIDDMVFTNRMMQALEAVANADDPLKQVYLGMSGADYDGQATVKGRQISLKKGAPLSPYCCSSPTQTPAPWNGTVVFDDPDQSKLTVNVPGFGLCTIDRSRLPNKKRRTTPAAPAAKEGPSPLIEASAHVRHLSLQLRRYETTDDAAEDVVLKATQVVHRLGAIVGCKLETFSLASELTDQVTVRHILDKFNKLHSLSIIDATIADLRSLTDTYQQGCQISSLDVSGSRMSMEGFRSLIHSLTSDPQVKRSLQRLRFGKDWGTSFFTQDTMHMISSMLKANKQLTHLHINIPVEAGMWNAVTAHQGEILPGSPLPSRVQLALASVLLRHQNASNSSSAPWDGLVMDRILAFVAPAKRRTVILEAPPPVKRDHDAHLFGELYSDDDEEDY